MVLADDVCDSNGAVILAADTPLSYAALTVLARHGIAQVMVAQAEEASEDQRTALRCEIEDHLSHRFRNIHDNPMMERLKNALIDHRMAKLK